MKKTFVLLFLTLFACGCAVGPNSRRSFVDVPGAYRGAPPPQKAAQAQQMTWQEAARPMEPF